jgi:D-aspartate oxidase
MKMKKVAILGAGINGLLTAQRFIELFETNNGPPFDITIIADKFNQDTTSDGAGGIFRPDDWDVPGVPKNTLRQWLKDSSTYFKDLLQKPDGGADAGVFQISGYQLFDKERVDCN